MARKYLLKLVSNGLFESVDEYVFNNSEKAITADNKQRYENGGVIIEDDGTLKISLAPIKRTDLAMLCRLAEIKPDKEVPLGCFCFEPEMVKLKVRNSVFLHEINGATYKATSTK